MLKKNELPYCPIATLLQIIGSKWKILILQQLEGKPRRFNELLASLNGISKKVLSSSLQELKNDGLIHRKISEDSQQIAVYCLNDLGMTLAPVLKEMKNWGEYYKQCRKEMDIPIPDE